MALTKRLNYYQDDDGYYRRIPWDSWIQDGAFVGLSPVGVNFGQPITWDSDGLASDNSQDFLDYESSDLGANKKEIDIIGLTLQTSERAMLEVYENVTGFYESEFSQTYEFDYDKEEYKE